MRFRTSVSGLSFQIFSGLGFTAFCFAPSSFGAQFRIWGLQFRGALGFQRLRVSGLGFDYVDAVSALSLHKGSSLNSGLFSDPFIKMENARGRGCCCKRFKV